MRGWKRISEAEIVEEMRKYVEIEELEKRKSSEVGGMKRMNAVHEVEEMKEEERRSSRDGRGRDMDAKRGQFDDYSRPRGRNVLKNKNNADQPRRHERVTSWYQQYSCVG